MGKGQHAPGLIQPFITGMGKAIKNNHRELHDDGLNNKNKQTVVAVTGHAVIGNR
jgi:hypothetical protein